MHKWDEFLYWLSLESALIKLGEAVWFPLNDLFLGFAGVDESTCFVIAHERLVAGSKLLKRNEKCM